MTKEQMLKSLTDKIIRTINTIKPKMFEKFKEGQIVSSKKFGQGAILDISGNKITVGFKDGEQVVTDKDIK